MFVKFLFQLSVLFVTMLIAPLSQATELGWQESTGLGGTTVFISLDPVLPQRGEPFTVMVSGKWSHGCIDDQIVLSESIDKTINLYAYTHWFTDYDCLADGVAQSQPKKFSTAIEIPASAWESIEVDPLKIDIAFYAGTIAQEHHWERSFDLIWGLHEIPPQIGAGLWVSDERPFQGLAIHQQHETFVLYDLTYNRDYTELIGEPMWLLASGKFRGNSTNGILKKVTWQIPLLVPEGPWNAPEYGDQPNKDELLFDNLSFGISVQGVNRIRFGINSSVFFETYKRRLFALGESQLPADIPDMSGRWNLYGFNEQSLQQSHQIEFRAATKRSNGWYRFDSVDGQWWLYCLSDLDGNGECQLLNTGTGLEMVYDLLDFNGNYAKSLLVNPDAAVPDQTGILLRSGIHLPVLDVQ